MKKYKTVKERVGVLKEITSSIEAGIKDMYNSDKYKAYLKTMSTFHKYSLNNIILIAMQRPDATQVAGFSTWKTKFSRNVKKGEKGIKIIAPIVVKSKKQDAVDEEQQEFISAFRVVTVFDVSQTEGKDLPTMASNLDGDVKQFDTLVESIKRSAHIPILFKQLMENIDGYYSRKENHIVIRDNMSEVQTISALVHEVAHSILHSDTTKRKSLTRNTAEVEAESVSYTVCSYLGVETSDNSFGYIAGWSASKELEELKSSLEVIRKTASELIDSIEYHLQAINCQQESATYTLLNVERVCHSNRFYSYNKLAAA